MRIVSANITGSLILNGVDVTDSLVSSSDISSSVSSKLDSLQSSTSSLNSFTSSYSTGSFTGSFKGDGTNLYNIPATGVTGLQLDKIASGAVTASVTENGFNVNSNVSITGSIIASGTSLVSGSSQINITGTTGYSTFSSSVSTSIGSLSSSVATTTNNLSSRVGSIETKSGSYATTGSNTFIGTENITGNLTVTGSVIVSSGSAVYNSSLNLTDTSSLTLNSGSNLYVYDTGIISGTFKGSVTGSLGINGNVSITGSIVASGTSLVSGSSQIDITSTTNYTTFSSSVSSSIGNLSSSVATNTSGLAGRITTIEGRGATTGSNTFVGSQVITGSLYITTDLIVQGSSSLQNITASAVSIGTNTVILNTDTPAVRFAGVSVQDSGSNAGVTGSIFWDGLCNRWVYSNPSGIGYSGGMLLSGPRTSTLGSESPLTCNYIAKSGGGDHLYDSCIIDDGTTVCVSGNLVGTGTACFSSSIIGTTTYSSTISCSPIGCFGTICSPSHIGGTFSGTNIYASTVSCSAVGKFSNCIEVGGTGTFASNLTATGTITMNKTGGYGILAQDDGNNLAANGAYIGWTNSLNTRYFIGQLDTSNDLNYHYFNGSTWATSIMKFKNNGAAFFAGQVCVGSASVATRSLVVQAGSTNQAIMFKNCWGGDGTLYACGNATALHYVFNTYSCSDVLFIANGGNIGIGLNNPASALHMKGHITFSEAGYDSVRLHTITHSHSNGSSSSNYMSFNVSDGAGDGTTAERMRINGTGTLLVYNLTCTCGIVSSEDVRIYRSAGTTTGYINFGSTGTNYLGFDGTRFSINGGINAGAATFSDTGDTALVLRTTNAGNPRFKFCGGGGVFNRSAAADIMYFGESSDTGLYMFRGGTLMSDKGACTGSYGFTHCGASRWGRFGMPNSSYMYLETNADSGFYIDGQTRVGGYFCASGNVQGNNLKIYQSICASGVRLGSSSFNTGYTSDGIYGATATPNYIVGTGYNSGFYLGYVDNGQGLYGAAYAFNVKCSHGGGGSGTAEYDAIRMRNDESGVVPFRITNWGNLYATSKNFRINHPLPSMSNTHHLVHTAIEGPQADLIYRGKVELVNGRAEVNIDESSRMTEGTFELLCQNVQSYTTNESGWVLIKSYVIGNILHIEAQDETSDDIISWLVIGERKDDGMKNSDITDNAGHLVVETLIPELES